MGIKTGFKVQNRTWCVSRAPLCRRVGLDEDAHLRRILSEKLIKRTRLRENGNLDKILSMNLTRDTKSTMQNSDKILLKDLINEKDLILSNERDLHLKNWMSYPLRWSSSRGRKSRGKTKFSIHRALLSILITTRLSITLSLSSQWFTFKKSLLSTKWLNIFILESISRKSTENFSHMISNYPIPRDAPHSWTTCRKLSILSTRIDSDSLKTSKDLSWTRWQTHLKRRWTDTLPSPSFWLF